MRTFNTYSYSTRVLCPLSHGKASFSSALPGGVTYPGICRQLIINNKIKVILIHDVTHVYVISKQNDYKNIDKANKYGKNSYLLKVYTKQELLTFICDYEILIKIKKSTIEKFCAVIDALI